LALAVSGSCSGRDQGADDLVVLDLRNGSVRRWAYDGRFSIRALAWTPDDRSLAFAGDVTSRGPCGCILTTTNLLDTDTDAPARGVSSALTLRSAEKADTTPSEGPVFWWHGMPATIVSHQLRDLTGGAKAKVLATGFPARVDAVSSDPTGNHLIVHSPGPNGGTTYRWDNGLLTRLPGHPIQAGW
jgi:hypothetical protein